MPKREGAGVPAGSGLNHDRTLLLQCLLLSAVLLFIDIALPLGIAGGIFQVPVVLLALRARDARFPLGFALLGSLLTMVGLLLSEPLGTPWMVYSNRAIALLAIWATALLGLRLKRYQSRLHESEIRFQLIADRAPLMIWRSDSQGDWDFISQGWIDFTGRPLATEQGQGWLANVHPEDREATRHVYAQSLARHERFEVRCRLRDARDTFRWVILLGVPRPGEGQDFPGFIGTALDISQRVAAESKLEATRQKYYHREKMAMIGTLAGGMLHEIGNPTAAITGLLQEALDELASLPGDVAQRAPLRQTLLDMQNQVERITRANLDIINFTRLQDATRDLHDLNQLIDRTCRLIRHDERMHAIKLVLDLDPSLPALEVVADHIVQLLFNLLENAIDGCQGVANPEIQVSTRRIGAEATTGVQLRVRDTGVGIPTPTLSRLKAASFSTHPAGDGCGLALCKAIAEEYRGDLEIESEPGRGTEAKVTLGCGRASDHLQESPAGQPGP